MKTHNHQIIRKHSPPLSSDLLPLIVNFKKVIMKICIWIYLSVSLLLGCKKDINTCELDICDVRRKTVMTAINWSGPLGYYNDLRKWAVNVPIPNTIDGLRTCIICVDIPDSLKTIGRIVTFSGELKESCNNPKPDLRGQEIYFVNPTKLE